MAVLSELPGVEVWVEVAQARAVEYECPDSEALKLQETTWPTSTKFIESVAGAEFSVCLKVTKEFGFGRDPILQPFQLLLRIYPSVKFDVFIDGKKAIGSFIPETMAQRPRGFKKVVSSVTRRGSDGQQFEQPFEFVALNTVQHTSKERIDQDRQASKGIGKIEIKIQQAKGGDRVPYPSVKKKAEPGPTSLAEEALKGRCLSHRAQYGKHRDVGRSKAVKSTPLGNPIAVLTFLYGSKDDLKTQLIIPRTPSPSPDLSSLTDLEIRQLAIQQLRQNKNSEAHRPVKRETNDLADSEAALQTKARKGLRGERIVIDLTD